MINEFDKKNYFVYLTFPFTICKQTFFQFRKTSYQHAILLTAYDQQVKFQLKKTLVQLIKYDVIQGFILENC